MSLPRQNRTVGTGSDNFVKWISSPFSCVALSTGFLNSSVRSWLLLLDSLAGWPAGHHSYSSSKGAVAYLELRVGAGCSHKFGAVHSLESNGKKVSSTPYVSAKVRRSWPFSRGKTPQQRHTFDTGLQGATLAKVWASVSCVPCRAIHHGRFDTPCTARYVSASCLAPSSV